VKDAYDDFIKSKEKKNRGRGHYRTFAPRVGHLVDEHR
jgi:hypothetical protein